jgi:hypothetical protein
MRTERFFFVIVLTFVSLFTLISMVGAKAADTGVVTATVSAQNIAVSVTDGTVTYGTLGMGSSANTTSTGGNHDSQTAQNTGNISESLNIKGQDSTAWTLQATAGSEQYTHKFCITNCDTTPVWGSLSIGYTTLATGIGVTASQAFDLMIGTPTVTTNYDSQSVNVTVQAVTGS